MIKILNPDYFIKAPALPNKITKLRGHWTPVNIQLGYAITAGTIVNKDLDATKGVDPRLGIAIKCRLYHIWIKTIGLA